MKIGLLTLLIVILAVPARAQSQVEPPVGLSLTALGGGAAFTAFQHGAFQALASGSDGTSVRQEFPRRISAKTSGSFAAAVAYWPAPKWGARLYASYSPSRFEAMVPQGDAERMADAQAEGAEDALASLAITALEAQGLVRLPTISQKLMPYAIVGIGAVRYAAEDGPLPEEAQRDFASGSQLKPAVRLGLGARLQMRPAGLGLNFELTDQVAKTPVRGDGGRDVSWTNAISFMVGMSLTLSRR